MGPNQTITKTSNQMFSLFVKISKIFYILTFSNATMVIPSLFRTKLLDRLTLRSERSILKKDKNCYSVAGVFDGKFCISPLEESHSFLPTHEHRENAKKASAKDANSSRKQISQYFVIFKSILPISVYQITRL